MAVVPSSAEVEPDRSAVDPLLRPVSDPGWREHLNRLRSLLPSAENGVEWSPLRVAAVLLFATALVFASWAALRTPAAPPAELSLPRAAGGRAGPAGGGEQPIATTRETTTPSTIVVHAAGAVRTPGVYRLPVGSRVGDLLHAAGGAGAGADVDRLNLAALLADGARFYVPRAGEQPPSEVTASGSTGGQGSGSGETASPVSLNTASVDDLVELPGVGPATAEAILRYREENGAFRSVEELLEVRGIGPAKLEQLRPLVTV